MVKKLLSIPADQMIITERVFNYPRALVYKAWSDPRHLEKWWGPKGFSNSFEEFDPRPGGSWKFVMHGPDQKDYFNESVFIDLQPPSLIAFKHLSGHIFHVVTTFEEIDAQRTRLVFRMIFESAEDAGKRRSFISEKNEENMDKLEKELASMNSQ